MRRLLAGALAGIMTAAVALGVAELAAAIAGPLGAPVIAVGETAINLTPIPVKEFAIVHFGSHDKEALITGIVVLLVAFAGLIGVRRSSRSGTDWPGSRYSPASASRRPSACRGTAVDVIRSWPAWAWRR